MLTKKYRIIITITASLGIIVGVFSVFAASAFVPDAAPIGYVGQPGVSSSIVSLGGEKLYAGDYISADWGGNLHSYNLSATGAISGTDNWVGGAAGQISSQNFETGRKIVTFSGTAGVPFKWSIGISASQKMALDATTAAVASSSSSPILNYIRGDISKQANQTIPGPYRSRSSVLGDIIHSTPVHWNDGINKTVFVGANDGMLHAINATDGKERFAYIPSVLIPKLSQLSNPAYTHQYYVDGLIDVSNFNGGTQSILIGALGAGGKGLFGLDVTNAAATTEADAANKILWEITNTGINSLNTSTHNPTSTTYANLGYTYGAPTLFSMPDGTKAVAVGNGYNNTGNGHASLFLINATTGALIKEIDTGAGTIATPNGLSSPSLWDTTGDGKKDTAYAGDIDGNLWKFSLVSPFAVTKLHTTLPAQAITTAPSIKVHPLGGLMINFVTGRMLNEYDKTNTNTHYAYGIWDGAPTNNSSLLVQTLNETEYILGSGSVRVRVASNNLPNWRNTHKGWQTALPVGGERLVGDGAFVKDSAFIFLTSNPTVSPNSTPPGENWWMQLNALTGGSSNSFQFDLNADQAFDIKDEVVFGGISQKPVGRYFGGGVRSQLKQLSALGNDVYQSNYDKNGRAISLPPPTTDKQVVKTIGKGVSGGHIDVDIYYSSTMTGNSAVSQNHYHEYDDTYDVTGVNMLNASIATLNLSKAIDNSIKFKVLAQNQYLSPAVSLHINGSPSYVFNVDMGYIPIKNFITSPTLDITDNTQVPTYKLSNINSLTFNMPVDAFVQKDWWAGTLGLPADVRVGLHPTRTDCVKQAAGGRDGNMYQPVIPPTTVTPTGNGTPGYNGGTTAATATGVRHNGALVIQIIKAETPNSAIELSVPNAPQYGWRVKSINFSTYVLAEYTVFWHHDNKLCYGEANWIKSPEQDLTNSPSTSNKATGSTDPKVGGFGAPVNITPSTVKYPTATKTVVNADGTTTTTTVDVTVVTNTDGSTTTTTITKTSTQFTNGSGAGSGDKGVATGGIVGTGPICTNLCGCSSATGGISGTGVCGPALPTGRVNWRELQL